MRVGIAAFAGSDNLGDEILLHALMSCVRAAREDVSFTVFAPNHDRVAQLHPVDAQPMPTIRARGAAARQAAVQRAIGDCDILFFGPGTVFQERSHNLPWPGTLAMFARILGMARLAGTPVAPVGVGVREGGTPVGRQVLRLIGAGSLAVGTRDRRSAGYFGRRAQVIGDLAYALPLPERGAAPTRQRLALSLRPLAAGTERTLIASVTSCVDRLRGDGWSAAFLPMAHGRGAEGEDDRSIYRRDLYRLMNAVPNPLEGNGLLTDGLDDWLHALAGHRLVLATRLHAALMAVALGVPTVAIGYERKVRDAFADLGLDRFVVAPDVDSAALYQAAVRAAGSPGAFREASARIASQGKVAQEFVASVLGRVA
jgi:polysaccharide pyruvyl transferase WcaK-like protein